MVSTTGVRFGYADTPLGQLHYAEAGSGDPLVLLHQTPRSLDEFAELLPLLARDFRTIAMDMYGFGQSAKPAGPQSIQQYAGGVLALTDALGIESFAVLGHHTGMLVASEVAAGVPARVTAAIFSGGEFVDDALRREAEGSDIDAAAPQEDGGHLTTLWARRSPLYPVGRPDLLDRFVRDALAPGVDPREGHQACMRYPMADRVDLVTAPILLLAATADPVSYPHTERLRTAYPRARTVEVAEIAGGMIPLMEHKSSEVAGAVTRFLDRVLGPSDRSRSSSSAD